MSRAALLATIAAVLPAVLGASTPTSVAIGRADGTLRALRAAAPAVAVSTIDDPLYAEQWAFGATDAATAWQLAHGHAPIIVAVVDTGVDAAHPDLSGKILPGWNFLGNNADTMDDNGHGTAVAGIIAAVTGNETGIASYCWSCLILPVKVLDAHGIGDNSTIAAGIRWAADHGARVINVSIGSLVDDGSLADAVAYARTRGALVIAAAGNLGYARPEYPAADPGAISVAGSDQNGVLFDWSENGSWVQLAAPGSNITTARGGGYASFTGTSAAAPVVSGIAALALSSLPTASGDAVASALQESARPTGGVQFGVVDAGRMLSELSAHTPARRGAPSAWHVVSTPS